MPTRLLFLLLMSANILAQNPLNIPPALSGTTFDLNLQTGTVQFFSGINTPTYGANGNILGPTLILQKHDIVTIHVNNNLPTSTTMHWHGLHVSAENDGGPHQIINAGATWSPSFEVLNDAATFWYHPHGEGKTDLHVSRGLAGMIIVKDSMEATFDLPRTYGVDDIPLVLQTKAFDELQQIAIATIMDTMPMVNATIDAYTDIPAQVVRLRLLNGASDRTFMLGFSNDMDFHQIATDGGLMAAPNTTNRLLLAPGERAEILVDFAAMLGDSVYLRSYGSEIPNGIIGSPQVGMGGISIPDYNMNPLNGNDFNLLKLYVISPTANAVTSIPTTLVPYTAWNTADADESRTFFFEPQTTAPQQMVEGPFFINAAAFDMMTTNITTYLDNIEIWSLSNQTQVAHPFHIHDVQFYVTDVNGNGIPNHMQGKKDVVVVMPMQTVSFITKFETFAGTEHYMYHCHLLHHEDEGMMGQFVVLDTTTGVKALPTASIRLHPNPAQDRLYLDITTNTAPAEVQITDILGRTWTKKLTQENSVDISELPKGAYFLHFQSNAQSFLHFIKHCSFFF